jgi:YidC/Oxa1 family membrane protein insertase
VLEKTAPGLELARDYGWLTPLAYPIFWSLEKIERIVGNWGWAIIILTILLKLALYPLSAAGYKSMAKMKKLTPRLQKLKDTYGDDRAKLHQAMAEMYKTEKINPLGGCLPIVIQIPVFIALYWVLLAAVEMRGAPWLGWVTDLTAPDPWYILPIVMGITSILQVKLNPQPMDPMQAKIMMIMPIAFTVPLFAGPQVQTVLEKAAPGLELARDYGWLTPLAYPIFWSLEKIERIVGNWGWAIIILTILLKLALYPLSAAGYKSMAKMKKLTPRLQKLKETYGDDRAKLHQAMAEMYKTEKINPLGGCLPILIQIPVFIALYWVLLAAVEMRGAPWLGWITDLTSPDPWFILPIVMGITSILQVKLNPQPMDPMQAKIMMIMPVAFTVMFVFFPAGLVLYWVVNNILSIAQQWAINKQVERAAAR